MENKRSNVSLYIVLTIVFILGLLLNVCCTDRHSSKREIKLNPNDSTFAYTIESYDLIETSDTIQFYSIKDGIVNHDVESENCKSIIRFMSREEVKYSQYFENVGTIDLKGHVLLTIQMPADSVRKILKGGSVDLSKYKQTKTYF